MNAALLNLAGFVGTLSAIAKGPGASAVSERDEILRRLQGPHSLITNPRHSSPEVREQHRELRARLDAELSEDPPSGWDDPDVDRYEDAEEQL